MMGSTGGPSTLNKDDKVTIDNLWKILATEKNINETVDRMQASQEKAENRSRSRNDAEKCFDQNNIGQNQEQSESALR